MAEYLIQEETLTDIANAIREKKGGGAIATEDMADAIRGLDSIELPKLNAPTISKTTGNEYDTINVTNPATNGNYASDIKYYVNDELVTIVAAPAAGASNGVSDISLYNGVDGEQTIKAVMSADSFTDSDAASISTTMYGVNFTPEQMGLDYEYSAIKGGGTLSAEIDNAKNNEERFLPIEISVKMNNEDCDYEWNNDVGYGDGPEDQEAYMFSRSSVGNITIPNVTGRLDVNIPLLELPELFPPTFAEIDGKILIQPSDYTERLHIYVDDTLHEVVQGVSYTVQLNEPAVISKGVIKMIQNGACTQVAKIIFNSPENNYPVKLRYMHHAISPSSSNYVSFSLIDTDLSATGDDVMSSLQDGVIHTASSTPMILEKNYTLPSGEHYINVKRQIKDNSSAISTTGYFTFIPVELLKPQKVSLNDYNPHTISAYCSADTSLDSKMASFEFQQTPACSVESWVVKASNIIPTVNQVEFYVNGQLIQTLSSNGEREVSYDFFSHGIFEKNSSVYVRYLGDGIDVSSPVVTADLSLYDITMSVDNTVMTVENILPATNTLELYINDELVSNVDYDGSGKWVVELDSYTEGTDKNTVTVKAINSLMTMEKTVTAYTNYQPIYGVSGLYSSTVALTRTDDAAGMMYTINSDGTINSDFDNVFPWCDTELVTDSLGNEFLQMPRMYFRVTADSSRRITAIAVSATHPNETGWYEVAPFCYGRYGGYLNGTKLESKSGKTRTASKTRANFRTYAKNNGGGYHQLDLYHHTVMMFLWWIEWATKNSQNIMTGCISGSGTVGGTTAMPTGGTDALATPSGYELTRRQMRYHYIEDFIGNYMEFIDGVYMGRAGTSYYDYATADPSKFSDTTTDLAKLAYPCNANYSYATVTAFGWDSNNPFLCTPTTAVNNSNYNTYFCDRVYRTTSSTVYPVPYIGALCSGSGAHYGLSYFYCYNAATQGTGISSRLMKTV